tara:strand:- start:9 stop:689 length:681 start_codon:yes stop_codon:yes gene_type:complete
MSQNRNLIYLAGHNSFFDKIIESKRLQILNIIKDLIKNINIKDALDIGTTGDEENKSSNLIIKNLKNIEIFKSISNQRIKIGFFTKTKQKSITENFSNDEINEFKSDLVLSSAVIEHVGSQNNQEKMIENIFKLTKKIFIITTPNRGYPVDFHTKIPFLHWLPKKVHRKILGFVGMSFFSKEENLNLLSRNDVHSYLRKYPLDYKIIDLKLLGLSSNFIIIGKIKN